MGGTVDFDGCDLGRGFDLAKLAEAGLFDIESFGLMDFGLIDFGLDAALGICQNGRENGALKGTGERAIIDGATFPRKALNNSPRAGGRVANLAREKELVRKRCKEQSSQRMSDAMRWRSWLVVAKENTTWG